MTCKVSPLSVVKRTAAKATMSLLNRHHLQQSFPDQTSISHRELTEPAWRSAAATVPGPPSVNGMLKCRLVQSITCRNTRPVIRPAEDIAISTVETVMSCLGPRVTINEMNS